MDIINHGIDYLSDYLSDESPICPLFGSSILIGRMLGKGKFGEVYLVTLSDMSKKEYAVKKILAETQQILKTSNDMRYYEKKYNMPIRTIKQLNPNFATSNMITLPTYSKSCTTKVSQLVWPVVKSGNKTTVSKGSFICVNEVYTEFAIGSLCANMYRQGICVNFIDMFAFATCEKRGEVNHYSFMEKINGTFTELIHLSELNEPEYEILIIQVLFAIACYQKELKLQHNDLSTSNVFIENVTDESIYKNQKLTSFSKYGYQINNKTISFPSIHYLAKIGDYGMSCKYSSPLIGTEHAIKGDESQNVPNWYSPCYDVLFFLAHIFDQVDIEFVNNIFSWIFELNPAADRDTIQIYIDQYFQGRPIIGKINDKIFRKVTAENILINDELMKYYRGVLGHDHAILGEI